MISAGDLDRSVGVQALQNKWLAPSTISINRYSLEEEHTFEWSPSIVILP